MKSVVEQIKNIYGQNWAAGVDEEEEIILRIKKTKEGYSVRQLKQDRGGVVIRVLLKDLENCENWIGAFIDE